MNHSHSRAEPSLESLVARWADVAAAIERGYTLTFDDYLNDVDLRQSIERRLQEVAHSDTSARTELQTRLREIDQHFVAGTVATDACVWGEANARDEGWSPERQWWYYRIPNHRPKDW